MSEEERLAYKRLKETLHIMGREFKLVFPDVKFFDDVESPVNNP